MKERPILFSGAMVRAILAGQKTQTRRVVNPGVIADAGDPSTWLAARPGEWAVSGDPNHCLFISPYGKPGDRLWVRETWGYRGCAASNAEPGVRHVDIAYAADEAKRKIVRPADDWSGIPKQRERRFDEPVETYYQDYLSAYFKSWRPSIHMPRWASRLTLEVTGVRVQRLQEISEEDARSEGVEAAPFCKAGRPNGMEHVEAFEDLWTAINGERPGCSWNSNPWVWCVSFRRAS